MKRPNRIALLLAGLLPALAGRTQELPGCMTPGVRAEMRVFLYGRSAFEPARPDVGWIREELDPVQRERRHLERMMRSRARERALEMLQVVGIPSPESRLKQYPHADPSVAIGEWRVSVGNNGNWSPYPDRALDARAIRYPMRDIRELDRAKKAAPPRPAPPK